MPENNLLDSIDVIGEGIHAMNVRLSNMPTNANFFKLQKKLEEALERQDFLIKLFITTSTSRFIKADSDLAVVNEEMKKILADIANMQKVLDSATKFIAAIDKFIGAITQIL